jgi:hypothetical protein
MRRRASRHLTRKEESTANERQKLGFGGETDVLFNSFASLEHHDRRNTAHAEFSCGERGFVDIELTHNRIRAELIRDLIDDGRKLLAGTAPGGSEINKNGFFALENFLFKIEIVEDVNVF